MSISSGVGPSNDKKDVLRNAIPPAWVIYSSISLALIKLWLAGALSLYAIGDAIDDDRLFLNMAKAMLSGHWLGPFSNLTLVKGPFYPFWIATTFLLGVPLLLSQQLLYILACIIFIIAIRPLLPKWKTLFALWAVLLFNPMTYTDGVMTRVIREGIYPALTLLVISGAAGMLARYDRPFKKLLPWSVCLGLSLPALWLTREEGVWIVPSLLVVAGYTIFRMRRVRQDFWRRFSLACILPFSLWVAILGFAAGMNKIKYGVFTTNELKSHDFTAAYGALLRVKHHPWMPFYPLPKETRERIYKASPAFDELAPFLEGDLGAGWAATSCRCGGLCNDIGGGWFLWAFRDAVSGAGHYSSAKDAMAYYRRLAAQVNSACDSGRLQCGLPGPSLMPPWRQEYAVPLIHAFAKAVFFLVRFDGFNPRPTPSLGSKESLLLFKDLTGTRLSEGREKRIQVSGWAFSKVPSEHVKLSVETTDKNDIVLGRSASPDVYRYFLAHGEDFPDARAARFNTVISCNNGCDLHIMTGHKDTVIPLDGSVKEEENKDFHFHMETFNSLDVSKYQSALDNFKISVLARIGRLYQKIVPFLAMLALIGYIISTVNVLRARTAGSFWLLNTALLLALGAMLFILSLINVTSFSAINTLYLSPLYPVLLIFIVLALPLMRHDARR